MKLSNKSKKGQDNFLLYIPKIRHTEWQEKNDRVYLVFHHNKPVERLMHWLVKKPATSDIELDEIGSFIWKSIDGKKNIHEIGKEVLNNFGNSCEPVYDRLIMFMRYLIRRGWITFEKNNYLERSENNEL